MNYVEYLPLLQYKQLWYDLAIRQGEVRVVGSGQT